MKKTNKKENDEMNAKRASKWLMLLILIIIIVAVGIIYALGSSSGDTIPPVTSIELSGEKQSDPYGDWYKDQALVTLSAIDGEDDGDNGTLPPVINSISGSSSLLSTSQLPGKTIMVREDFNNFEEDNENNMGLWDLFTEEDGSSYSLDGDLINMRASLYSGELSAVNLRTRNLADPAKQSMPVWAEARFRINEFSFAEGGDNQEKSSFGFGVSSSEDGGGDKANFRLSHSGQLSFNATSDNHDPAKDIHDGITTDIPIGQMFRLRVEVADNSVSFMADLNDDGNYEHKQSFEFNWGGPFVVSAYVQSWAQNALTDVDIDYIYSNIVVDISGSYLLESSGASLDGVAYADDVSPLLGSPEPVLGILWFGSRSPAIIPGIVDEHDIDLEITLDGPVLDGVPNDIYAYLLNLAGFKITIFDSKKPPVFASVVKMFNEEMGVPASVLAFAKATSYNTGAAKYEYASLPIVSEGTITYENGEAKVLPPSGGGGAGPVVSGVDKIYYRVGKSGSFNVYTNPFIVSLQGINEIYYYSTDKAGNVEPMKSITAKVDTDEDGDGIYGNFDRCPSLAGSAGYDGCPYAIDIDSEIHVNYIGGSPKFNQKLPVKVGPFNDPLNQSITSVEAKVYKLSDLGSPYGHIQQNCGDFYDYGSATPINAKSLPNGNELIGVPKADQYVVMQKIGVYEPKLDRTSILITCRNVEVKDFSKNISKKQMPLMKSVKGNVITLSGAQTTVMTGSMLEVLYPENVMWEEGTESYVYTYIFTSDSDWTVDICNYVPEGYIIAGVYDDSGQLVSTSECAQAFVANQTKIVAFEVKDVGSPKVFDVDLKITGKRTGEKKEQKANIKVNTKITPKAKMAKSGKVNLETKARKVAPKGIMDQIRELGERNKKATKDAIGPSIGKKITNTIRKIIK